MLSRPEGGTFIANSPPFYKVEHPEYSLGSGFGGFKLLDAKVIIIVNSLSDRATMNYRRK